MDGILNINKPWGKTSFSIVAMVRRLTGERRVGHAGTLDPAAIGVLPVCLGRGTRIIEFLVDATKTYRAEIQFGTTTDTYDGAGSVVSTGDPSGISREGLESALSSFRGPIWQTPPMYSAVKYHGRPLYELARAGITVERRSRLARVDRLELIEWQPPVATIEVDCGKGTYIRSLAHDLGQSLGCGAFLQSLVRSRYGVFKLADAVSVPQLEEACRRGYWQQFVHPVDSVLSRWPAVVVGDDAVQDIKSGRPVVPGDSGEANGVDHARGFPVGPSSESRCRAYALDGRFLGVLRFNSVERHWHPEKVFV